MANVENVTFTGIEMQTNGLMPKVGVAAPDFTAVAGDLSEVSLSSFKGKKVVLNIFPSLDTSVCATSVRKFNEAAASLDNVVVLAVSMDLPFAQGRFCTTEGIDNVKPLSLFRSNDFASSYGLVISNGILAGLTARAVIVVDENGVIAYEELVSEITNEPNYAAAIEALK